MLAAADDLPPFTLTEAWKAHARSLRAAGRSPHTLKGRKVAVDQLAALCEAQLVAPVVGIHLRAVIEAYLAQLLDTQKPTVAETRFDQLHAFFGWLVKEEELSERDNPLRRMVRPAAPILPVQLISDKDLAVLLRTCKGRSFADLRDTAIIRVLMDTGMRVGGLVSMLVGKESLDLDRQKAQIRLKAGRLITVPLGAKSTEAIGRYLRARSGRRVARTESALWITRHARVSACSRTSGRSRHRLESPDPISPPTSRREPSLSRTNPVAHSIASERTTVRWEGNHQGCNSKSNHQGCRVASDCSDGESVGDRSGQGAIHRAL